MFEENAPSYCLAVDFLSTGQHSAKWTGDNGATWDDLKASIVGVMDFNLFGVPMIGADICGFIYDTTEELCARWIEVGAFYPFSRDHNTLGAAPQELYLWPTVTAAAQTSLGLRYQLLPYIYTTFAGAHFNGATVARALWFNFPTDPNCIGIDGQFMLGSSVMLSPVLTQGATSVSAYFPQAYWYNLFTRTFAIDASAGGKTVVLNTPLTSTNAHMRGGSILPMQESAMTTTAGRLTPFTLLAGLCSKNQAKGSLFWDDGEQIQITQYVSASYSVTYASGTGTFVATVESNTLPTSGNYIVDTVQILSASPLTAVTQFTLTVTTGGKTNVIKSNAVVYTSSSISFTKLGLTVGDSFTLVW